MNSIRFTISCLLLTIGFFAFGQKQNIRFEHLGIDQGLSQSNVLCALQDSRGFMWFGTRDGLNKYDGYKFTTYKNNVNDPGSLSNNFVRSIFESKNGNLWVATAGGGLCLYDRLRDRFTSFKYDRRNANSISNDFVSCVMEDSQGNIWAGTENGLNIFDTAKSQFTRYKNNTNDLNSISDNYVRYIYEDSRHNLWVGTFNGGLNLLNRKNKTFTRFQHDAKNNKSICHNNVYTLFEDSKHRLWIGTNGGGLDLFNNSTGEFSHFTHDDNKDNSLAANSVYAINEDSRHNLWIGTENGGLSLFDPEKNLFYTYQNDEADNSTLSNNSVYCIYKDAKKNMWLGTFNGGVNLVNPDARRFTHYKHILLKNSLSNNNVLCIKEDTKKNIWIGTDGGGLNLFDPKTNIFTCFRHEKGNKNSICGDYVLTVQEDSKGNLWIGTWADGVTVFNRAKNTFTHYKNDPNDMSSLSNNNAWKIFEDRERNIWIGTYGGGLNLFDSATNSFTRYLHKESDKESLSGNNIYSVYQDSDGKLWIGTDGAGLNLFDKNSKKFSHFFQDESKNSISNNTAVSIYEDSRNNLWITTMNGLSLLNKRTSRFTNYTTADGLPNNVIFGILEDRQKNIWVSTGKGISRFNPDKKVFKNFDISDGLQSNEFKQQAYCQSTDGTMYFGGNNGFNQFFPDSIKENSFEPPLVITSFQIFNKEVPISGDSVVTALKKDISETQEITIPYNNSVISFEFASLNYTIAEKKQYAYMLESFDQKWNNIGTRRIATYTNLDPGTYIFKVKGLNNDGSWSETIKSLTINITPPFWMTWWFRLLVVGGIVLIVITIHRVRMASLNARNKKLENQVASLLDKAVAQGKSEIASDVMHDIGNAVVGFGSYLTRIRRMQEEHDPAENLQNLAKFFEENKTGMIEAIGDVKAGAVITMLGTMAQTQISSREEIGKSITEQLNIITNIQEILNIQRQYINGNESKERKPVKIGNVINDSLSMLFSSIDKSAIAVSLDVPADLPYIKGDRTKLIQLILNILKNSLEAIDINSTEKNISIRAYSQADRLILQVRDSGEGFDKSVASQLFRKGFTTKPSGAGVGLYSCKTIMESHEGSIEINSDGHGRGALATIGFKI